MPAGIKAHPEEVSTAKRTVTLPPNVGKQEFERAISDLCGLLGTEHVAINDGPLNDGDYYTPALSHDRSVHCYFSRSSHADLCAVQLVSRLPSRAGRSPQLTRVLQCLDRPQLLYRLCCLLARLHRRRAGYRALGEPVEHPLAPHLDRPQRTSSPPTHCLPKLTHARSSAMAALLPVFLAQS